MKTSHKNDTIMLDNRMKSLNGDMTDGVKSTLAEKEKCDKLIDALKKKAMEILPKGSRVTLYGSRARGDAGKDSDWDLHVMIPGPEKISWDLWDVYAFPFADVGLAFDEIVNPRLYSIVGWNKRNFLPFYKNVERDSIVLFRN